MGNWYPYTRNKVPYIENWNEVGMSALCSNGLTMTANIIFAHIKLIQYYRVRSYSRRMRCVLIFSHWCFSRGLTAQWRPRTPISSPTRLYHHIIWSISRMQYNHSPICSRWTSVMQCYLSRSDNTHTSDSLISII